MKSDYEALAHVASEESRPKSSRGPGRPTLSNEQLLDKALDIFLEKGFERTSIDAITASAGMAKRTVYLRYGDKTALFKAALERAIDEWIVPVETLRAAESDDLEETLLRVGQILLANVMSPGGLRLLRITNAESARMPEIGVYTYTQGTERTIAYLADLLRRRVKPGGAELADPDQAALAFLYLVVGGPPTVAAWGASFDQATLDKHTRYCVALFLHGLLAQGAAERRVARETRTTQPDSNPLASATQPADLQALEHENRRLRTLLVESMLEVAALKERRTNG